MERTAILDHQTQKERAMSGEEKTMTETMPRRRRKKNRLNDASAITSRKQILNRAKSLKQKHENEHRKTISNFLESS